MGSFLESWRVKKRASFVAYTTFYDTRCHREKDFIDAFHTLITLFSYQVWGIFLKVLIIGHGNLGHDLLLFCKKYGLSYHLISTNEQRFSDDFDDAYEADLIINTVGGGVHESYDTLWKKNISLNLELSQMFIDRPIIAFSSNAALEPYRTPYSSIKKSVESLTGSIKNFHVIRVSTLYGNYRLSDTFPWKLRNNYIRPTQLNLPTNYIQPTPTKWLAEKIFNLSIFRKISSLENRIFSIVPFGHTTYEEWGKVILGEEYKITPRDYDPLYTKDKILVSNYPDTWEELWNQHKI